tara:strand:- start:394 stop:1608 length:1215 start_codon:yes stop_codon:yes gene_type:complete
MMDRYEDDEIELAITERSGAKFIGFSRDIYLYMKELPGANHGKLEDALRSIYSASDALYQLWIEFERERPRFSVPKNLREDYSFAKHRYAKTKGSPETFYKHDDIKKEELLKEKDYLVTKIRDGEIEFARFEDEKRHEIKNQRENITEELAVLKYKKKKYEARNLEQQPGCLPLCGKKKKDKLPEVLVRLDECEAALKELGREPSTELEDKRYQLNLLHRRRWDVDKSLNTRNGNHMEKMKRWKNAIDNAEMVMIVRQMDIDDAVIRHYSEFPRQLIHAFLNAYTFINDAALLIGGAADEIKAELEGLEKIAELIYCADIANRSVSTLYKKIQILSENDRAQVIYHKPVEHSLPEALLRTFSVKNLKDTVSSLGLYRKVLPNKSFPGVEQLDSAKENEDSMSLK